MAVFSTPFKKLLPPFVLHVVGVPNLELIHTVSRIPALRQDAFKILFTNEPEHIASVSLEVAGQENPWVVLHDAPQHFLSFQQRQRPQIPAIVHQDIQGVKDRPTTAA
jgi:hypothetical protein